MQAASETGEVFALLEGGASLTAMFGVVRDAWLTRGLLQYHARTGSSRTIDALARAPDHHARHLLDALAEELSGVRTVRAKALSATAALLSRRPAWLHRVASHPTAKLLAKAARSEREAAPRLHALLALAALCGAGVGGPAPCELAPGLARALLAPEPQVVLGAHALFHALYQHQPTTLLEALQQEYRAIAASDAHVRERLERALAELSGSARLHPHLIVGSGVSAPSPQPRASPPPPAPPCPLPPGVPPPACAVTAARAAASLRPPLEPWFPLGERCGADSAPLTPLPPDAPGGSPPEAAVEATPENTPAKEARAFTFPNEGSGAVRALGRLSQPPSPLRKEGDGHGARLARVVLERAQADPSPGGRRSARPAESPIPFGGAPPAAVARPEPRGADLSEAEPFNVEDREVLELTSRAEAAWTAEGEVPAPRPLRVLLDSLPRRRVSREPRRGGRPRAVSCPPRAARARRHASVQTVDTHPEPYEFILCDMFKHLLDERDKDNVEERVNARLDEHLAALYSGDSDVNSEGLARELALTHASLQFERFRRTAHAERSRRLLGRCRQARALELANAALKDRVRLLQRDVDELRSRSTTAVACLPAPAERLDLAARLAVELEEERDARAQAEAMLHEAEVQLSVESAELGRVRGAQWESRRRLEALARAAAAATRRTERARRLRKDLHLLAPPQPVPPPTIPPSHAAALRAAKDEAIQARAEAEVAIAKAEAAQARATDLEASLATKESCIAELKKTLRLAADQHAARLAALQDKYRALMHVLRRMEARRLESLAGGPPPPPPASPPHSSPLSSSLASGSGAPALADCRTVRRLLDDEPAH